MNGVCGCSMTVDCGTSTVCDTGRGQCVTPLRVIDARAVDATHATVTFDHDLDASTVVPGHFAISDAANSLAVSAATLATSTSVTLTTSSQGQGTLYTVTVTGVTDTVMTAVDPANDTARFHGFGPIAQLIINEFTPGIANGYDLLELKAQTGGSVRGFRLQQDLVVGPKTLATLPDQVVLTGDILVLHITPTPPPSSENELATETECNAASCYGTAWDSNGVDEIGNSGRVLTIQTASGQIQDGVAFFNAASDGNAAFVVEMQALHNGGFWACATATCVATDATRSNGCGNTATGKSLKRTSVTTPPAASNWPSTGLTNSNYGQ